MEDAGSGTRPALVRRTFRFRRWVMPMNQLHECSNLRPRIHVARQSTSYAPSAHTPSLLVSSRVSQPPRAQQFTVQLWESQHCILHSMLVCAAAISMVAKITCLPVQKPSLVSSSSFWFAKPPATLQRCAHLVLWTRMACTILSEDRQCD